MRALEEVRAELLSALQPLDSEEVILNHAAGRVLASAPSSTTAIPPVDTVAMDGYAVRAADTRSTPVRLQVIGRVAPGETFSGILGPGQTVRVFTGAPLPPGADAVVMQEDTELVTPPTGEVTILEGVKPWESVRFRGEDVALGRPLLAVGGRLGPAKLGLLAAAGVSTVRVSRRPRVGILVTGSELVIPGQPLKPGQIYESNSLMLRELLLAEGVEVEVMPAVPDREDALAAALDPAWARVDLLVTSGGASVGEPDLVRSIGRRLGGTIFDGEVALKPGKPFFWGMRSGRLLTGLPGNPVSAFVTAVLLVLPAVRRLAGRSSVLPPWTPALLAEPLINGDRRRHFVRVRTEAGRVSLAGVQASHRLGSLALADGLVDVPPRQTLPQGASVSVIRWNGVGSDCDSVAAPPG
ncbi:MAG: molybdopterin molybdotransferase MoeA [Verrucomicrobia bacterium]|nr:molybdopterin molybdotransferase MoeA [Verrucomicrobiota bacterium]